MRFSRDSRFALLGATLSSLLFSGCILVGEFDDVYYERPPKALTYEACYSNVDCLQGDYCEELALPADLYTDFVNAICTFQCFDELDCPYSEFNGLPGACVDHAILGGPYTSRICVERCEFDADCDVAGGFGCEVIGGDRLCVPIQ